MNKAYICDYIRTPIGRYGGSLSAVRPDDLCAHTMKALLSRHEGVPGGSVDEVWIGCANQAGEDNRNVARMAVLLAGMPSTVPAVTINRLCASGLDAVIAAARAINVGQADLAIAGGVESMSRSPLVFAKAETAFSRKQEVFDTTLGWRFVNPRLKAEHGVDSMPETAENVARDFGVTREAQDKFALASQRKAAAAIANGRMAIEIVPVTISPRRGPTVTVANDEHPRETSFAKLSALPAPFAADGTVTAGNASGINDGAAAMLIASDRAVDQFGLEPLASILGGCSAGVEPRVMGIGPAHSTRRLLQHIELDVEDFDVIELNEAFASQCLATMRLLGLSDDCSRVNVNGGAIALGHPLGMSGARIAGSAALELSLSNRQTALATMCVGVGQGVSLALKRA
ncbi:MAG: 3-oxoadipyl-CoA thiolase [Rhodobacteraceae bacterium]|nr:3-oxoadipyl-CoA thiolase [Paracoccaceae bacterium]